MILLAFMIFGENFCLRTFLHINYFLMPKTQWMGIWVLMWGIFKNLIKLVKSLGNVVVFVWNIASFNGKESQTLIWRIICHAIENLKFPSIWRNIFQAYKMQCKSFKFSSIWRKKQRSKKTNSILTNFLPILQSKNFIWIKIQSINTKAACLWLF